MQIRCRIQLLDGTDVEQEFNKKDLGEVIFDFVCDHLKLIEKDYFGCSFVEGDVKYWLRNDKKISKQSKGDLILTFEVKFYPLDLMRMKDDTAKYLLYLQLRKDILIGKLPASFVSQVLLGALAIQSQLSDYDRDEHHDTLSYLNGVTLATTPNEELLDKVAEMHKKFNGLSQEEAEYSFIDNARLLSMYGVHKHSARDLEGKDVIIGVYARGLLIFYGTVVFKKIIWAKIIKIYYKKNKFFIRMRKDENEEKDYNLVYKLDSVVRARNLWRLAMEHHTFFRLKEATDISIVWYRGGQAKVSYPGKTLQQTSTYDFIKTLPRTSNYNTFKSAQLGTERGEELMAEVIKPAMLTLRGKNNTSRSTIPINAFDYNEGNINSMETLQRANRNSQLDKRSISLDSSVDVRSNPAVGSQIIQKTYYVPPATANSNWDQPVFEHLADNQGYNAKLPSNVVVNGNPPHGNIVVVKNGQPGSNGVVVWGNGVADRSHDNGGYVNRSHDDRVVVNGGYGNVEDLYDRMHDSFDDEDDDDNDDDEERGLASAIQRVTNMDQDYQVSRIEVYTNVHPTYSDV